MIEAIYKVSLRLTEPMLGTTPRNKDVFTQHVANKAVDAGLVEEEVATCVEELEARGWTGFHEDEQGPFVYDYFVKGFLKETARTLKQFGATKNLRDKVNRYLFVTPRRVRLPKPESGKLECIERPLRAETAQGPRVTVARSDLVPSGQRKKAKEAKGGGDGVGIHTGTPKRGGGEGVRAPAAGGHDVGGGAVAGAAAFVELQKLAGSVGGKDTLKKLVDLL